MVDSQQEQLSRMGCLWVAIATGAVGLAVIMGLFIFSGDDPGAGEPDPAAGPPSNAAPPPAATGSPTSGPAWTVTLADPAGGLRLVFADRPEVTAREQAMTGAGIPVRGLVDGVYEDPDDTTVVVDFNGGQLTTPAGDPQAVLAAAFDATFPNLTPAGGLTQYDAGSLGGELWCRGYAGSEARACGWVDESTIGIGFAVLGPEPDLAARLAQMRTDLQVPVG